MPNFISFAASIAELAHGEKLCTQSLTQSPSLFDAPATEAFASGLSRRTVKLSYLCSTVSNKQRNNNALLNLSTSANTPGVATERHTLLVRNHVFEVHDGATKMHVFDGLSSLTSVLQFTTTVYFSSNSCLNICAHGLLQHAHWTGSTASMHS